MAKKVDKKKKGAKPKSRKGMVGTHYEHPKCPKCKKAMYKAAYSMAVKTTDPWAYCRNPDCELHGVDQSGEARPATTLEAGMEKAEPKTEPKAEKKGKKAKAKKAKTEKKAKKAKTEKKAKKAKTEKVKKTKTEKIAKALKKGGMTQGQIAEKFGCSRKKVRTVRNQLQDEGLI